MILLFLLHDVRAGFLLTRWLNESDWTMVNQMWFKAFVLLRLPVSVICMLGYSFALSSWNDQSMGALGATFVVGTDFFLAVTSIRLFWRRNSALNFSWWLLAMETVGGVCF